MAEEKSSSLDKSIGLWQASSIVVGTIIGTGIFLKTSSMTQLLGSFGMVMLVWVLAGVLSYAGALTYAELSARHPHSGGEYVFLREAYGGFTAFLYGWMRFCIAAPGSIAAYAVGSATFASGIGLLPVQNFPGKISGLAVAFIVFFTLLNCLKVQWGARVQTFLTILKCALILALVFAVMKWGNSPSTLTHLSEPLEQVSLFSAFGLAMIAALWAFDGWNNLPMVGEEIHEPKKNLPKALALGVVAVLILYLLANWSYFQVLSPHEIQLGNSNMHPDALPVGTLAAKSVMGEIGVPLLSLAFVISALGAMNGSMLTGARVPFAMARDGVFFRSLAVVSESSQVPVRSVLLQGVIASGLSLSGTFDQLTDWVVVSSWVFYALCISTLFIFRKRDSLAASFQVPGYPVLPIMFIGAAILLVGNSMWSSPTAALFGVGVIFAGTPIYYWHKRSK